MADIRTRLRRLPHDAVAALGFFSRLPVRTSRASLDLRQSAGAWPIAGLLLAGVPAVALLLALALHLGPLIAALSAVAAGIAMTGGLHEDGLADTADGFGGGRDRDAKLAIMRDSRLGTYGGIALILAILLKAGALLPLVAHPSRAIAALLTVAVVSRSLAVWHWQATPPARREGLAWTAGRPDWLSGAISSGLGLAGALALALVFGAPGLLGLVLAAGGVALFSDLCRRQIGGHTGDTIGAAQQIAEILLLTGISSAWPGAWQQAGLPIPI